MQFKPAWRPNEVQGMSLSEYRFSIFSFWALSCGAVSHFFLVFLFIHIGLNIMAFVNVISVIIYLLCIYLVYKHILLFPFLLAILEINVQAGLAAYFVGWDAGFQYFIFLIPVASFFFPDKRVSFFCSFFSLLFFSILLLLLVGHTPPFFVPEAIVRMLHLSVGVTTLIILSVFAFAFRSAVDATEDLLQIQFNRAESLLKNILPSTVAKRLHEKEQPIADGFPEASILFADLQDFTRFSGTIKPNDLVQILNDYFSEFDDLLDVYGIEKIKTIGDAYMVAAGLPEASGDHAEAITEFALAMLATTRDFNRKHGKNFSIRIGINSGPVVAGVIGKKKYIYDLWGDTVNVASRMEASGEPGQIHITENTYRLIREKYDVIKRDPLQIKGKGLMQTYFININEI